MSLPSEHKEQVSCQDNPLVIPEWISNEVRNTWNSARSCGSQIEAFRLFERMVDRIGYGRLENNPPLFTK
jgi:hypothetical protein